MQNDFIMRQGIPCLILTNTASTNSDAKEYAKSMDEGLVIALSQTSGRGRFERSFVSRSGLGAYFSYFFTAENENYVDSACVAALGVVGVLSALGLDAKIKWPNDVLVNNKKICGILPESVIVGEKRSVIIGIGVNLNYEKTDFPSELQEKATSLKIESGIFYEPKQFALDVITVFKRLMTEDKKKLIERYRALSTVIGRRVSFGGELGKAVAIDDDYSLIVEYSNGKKERRNWGEIVNFE